MPNKILKIYFSITSAVFIIQFFLLTYFDFLLTKLKFLNYKGKGVFLSKLLCWLYIKISGIEVIINYRTEIKDLETVGSMFVYTHASILDPFLINGFIKGNTLFIGKKELWKIPIVKQVFNHMEGVPIDRKNREEAIKTLDMCLEKVKKFNKIVTISPEGTRRREKSTGKPSQLLPFKKGPFHMAKQANIKIVPIIITGSHRMISSNPILKNYGTIYLDILPPIETDMINKLDYNELLSFTENKMRKEVQDIPDSKIFTKPNFIYNFIFVGLNLFVSYMLYIIFIN